MRPTLYLLLFGASDVQQSAPPAVSAFLRPPLVLLLHRRSHAAVEPVAPATATYRDRQVLRMARDVLDTTGEFHELTTWGMPEQRGSSSESYKLAVFELAGWSEENFADDYAGTDVIHMVEYTLTLCVRDADPDARDDELDRLVCVAHNALSGASIGGLTYADWTYLKRGRYGPSLGPERHMVVTGQFAYNAEDWSVHNALPLT